MCIKRFFSNILNVRDKSRRRKKKRKTECISGESHTQRNGIFLLLTNNAYISFLHNLITVHRTTQCNDNKHCKLCTVYAVRRSSVIRAFFAIRNFYCESGPRKQNMQFKFVFLCLSCVCVRVFALIVKHF